MTKAIEELRNFIKDKKVDPFVSDLFIEVIKRQAEIKCSIQFIYCWLGLITGSVLTILLKLFGPY